MSTCSLSTICAHVSVISSCSPDCSPAAAVGEVPTPRHAIPRPSPSIPHSIPPHSEYGVSRPKAASLVADPSISRDSYLARRFKYKVYFEVASELMFVAIVDDGEDFPTERAAQFLKTIVEKFTVRYMHPECECTADLSSRSNLVLIKRP